MAEKPKSEIKITPADVQAAGNTLTVLTGNTLEEKHLLSVQLAGILSAPADYLEHKKGNWEPKNCHVRVDYTSGTILLFTDEKLHNGDVIKGALEESTILKRFKINTGAQFTNAELQTLFRTNKYWFAGQGEDQLRILTALQKFNATVQTKMQQHNSNSGNTLQSLEREVSGIEWNRTFRLNIPVFEGYEKFTVPVEIVVVPDDTRIKFYLESPEVYELIEASKAALIEAEIARFRAWGCSVVRTS